MWHLFTHPNGTKFSYIKEIKELDKVVIMRFQGAVDAETIPIIGANMKKKHSDYVKKNALIDLKGVTHVDTSTLAAFIEMIKERKESHSRVGLINVPETSQVYLDIEGLRPLATIYKSEEEAIKDLA